MCLDEYEAFAASMPTSYHEVFDGEAVQAHAGVVSRREGSATRVEIWKELPERVVAICIVAALNLFVDFHFIEQGARAGAPTYMSWYCAFGLLATLIWLYLEILRLLSKIRG